MKLTEREDLLMRRALDPASAPAEAAKAAEAFVNSLRKRLADSHRSPRFDPRQKNFQLNNSS
jgi:hypothetical protein